MKNITAIIVTFLRDEYLNVCVESLKQTYPDISIIIGDQNPSEDKKKHFESLGARYVELEYDCGLCKARNELVRLADTNYILIGDDDFKYNEGAKVEEMLKIIEGNKDIDLVGGRIIEGRQIKNYQGFIEEKDKHFIYKPLEDNEKSSFVDLIFNFFVAKRSAVVAVKWDDEIKVAYEHSSFFIDFKRAGYKAFYCPDSIVIHKPFVEHLSKENHNKYIDFRSRKSDKKRFFTKYGIDYAIDMHGNMDTYDPTGLEDIDFLITHFERKDCLENLLFSIAKYYPHANIFIGDNSKKFIPKYYNDLYFRLFEAGLRSKPRAFSFKYDAGLSEVRNFLFENTNRKYKLILEDDFVFTEDTKINKLVEIMEAEPLIGIVGGKVMQDGHEIKFEHYLEKKGKTIYHKRSGEYANGWKYTGCVPNFCLIRANIGIKWDGRIKISGEHTDFFLKLMQTDWKVAYTRECSVDHVKINSKEYKLMRGRDEFLKIMFENHNIDRIVYLTGYTMEYRDGKIITHT